MSVFSGERSSLGRRCNKSGSSFYGELLLENEVVLSLSQVFCLHAYSCMAEQMLFLVFQIWRYVVSLRDTKLKYC